MKLSIRCSIAIILALAFVCSTNAQQRPRTKKNERNPRPIDIKASQYSYAISPDFINNPQPSPPDQAGFVPLTGIVHPFKNPEPIKQANQPIGDHLVVSLSSSFTPNNGLAEPELQAIAKYMTDSKLVNNHERIAFFTDAHGGKLPEVREWSGEMVAFKRIGTGFLVDLLVSPKIDLVLHSSWVIERYSVNNVIINYHGIIDRSPRNRFVFGL